MMLAVHTFALLGLRATEIVCEIDLALQLPGLQLVGLPSSLTQESRERVRAAIQNSGFEWPARKVLINMVPADIPKWGTHFELAMALGILAAGTQDEASEKLHSLNRLYAFGELSLSGEIRACGWLGGLPLKHGIVFAHPEDCSDITPSSGLSIFPVRSLREAFETLLRFLISSKVESFVPYQASDAVELTKTNKKLDVRQLQGEPLAQLACVLASEFSFHTLFAGPQGTGKTFSTQITRSRVPCLSSSELRERKSLFAMFGRAGEVEAGSRPVVNLQTSASRASLEGALLNSGQVVLGEFSRAHHGVLIADEWLERPRDVLESFRLPLEEGVVRLQRAKLRTEIPAKFQLLATTNLCPCGNFGSPFKVCRCPRARRVAYQSKLSGPVLDRFDLIVGLGMENKIPRDVSELLHRVLSKFFSLKEKPVLQIIEKSETIFADWLALGLPEVQQLSKRAILKCAKVARALAALEGTGQEVTGAHRRLALSLRADVDLWIRNAEAAPLVYR